jgi:predicted metal-dependent hydrolase
MSMKSSKVATLVQPFQGRELDAHYLAYFECFRCQRYFEAHEVLEELWLADRAGANGGFYKGLIQLAGAFVHLQKNRLRPAAALFRLAEANLQPYPAVHEQLNVTVVLDLARQWRRRLESGQFQANPLASGSAPELDLRPGG